MTGGSKALNFIMNRANHDICFDHPDSTAEEADFTLWATSINNLTLNPYWTDRLEAYMLTLIGSRPLPEKILRPGPGNG